MYLTHRQYKRLLPVMTADHGSKGDLQSVNDTGNVAKNGQ